MRKFFLLLYLIGLILISNGNTKYCLKSEDVTCVTTHSRWLSIDFRNGKSLVITFDTEEETNKNYSLIVRELRKYKF